VTVGEKIGKAHLTYAQGASAELVAATTILLSTRFGLPVSTTHVLSSGIAGTMAANKSGLQAKTLRNIALAWVLTLPVTMLLSAILFSLLVGSSVREMKAKTQVVTTKPAVERPAK
jgi:inorganic phosphate transporter, PiT family